MESVRKKKTITRNQQCLDPFSMLPLDLLVEILMKLPAKSIAILIFVSKHWSSIIRSKDFTKLYMTQSLTRPRFLFEVIYNETELQFLESCTQEDPYSDHQKVNITQHTTQLRGFSPPVRGLISHQNDTKVMIENPSTGQFITLPKVKTRRKGVYSFFGYDPVNDVYKVLCMTVRHLKQKRGSQVVSDEHQVFTLKPKQKWRKITCKHPHLPPPRTKGICINGVVYYYAWIKSEGSLICFDLTFEDFNVIKLPWDINGIVNYGGKIALCRQKMYNNNRLDLCVLQDAKKQEWSKVFHLVPSWTELVGEANVSFVGKLTTGQLIFAPLFYWCTYPYFLISYDPEENKAKKVVIEGIENYSPFVELYFDHVENPMLLSDVS